MQALGGRAARALRDQISWRNCGEASRSEGETTVGSLTLVGPPAHLAATCALPTSTTATAVILSNVQDEPQSIRLATCLDRSAAASGAIASTVSPCLPWRKLLPLTERLPPAERLALVERPRRRAAHRAGASRRTGLSPSGDRWRVWAGARPAVEALRTVARAWRATRPSWKTDRSRAGSAPPRGLGGPRRLWSKPDRL